MDLRTLATYLCRTCAYTWVAPWLELKTPRCPRCSGDDVLLEDDSVRRDKTTRV